MIRNSFEEDCGRVEDALCRATADTDIDRVLSQRRLVDKQFYSMLQKVQAEDTKLVVVKKSPDIRTGVLGYVSGAPPPFIRPKMPIRYAAKPYHPKPIYPGQYGIAPPLEPASPVKKAEPGTRWFNVLDRFFLWVNSTLERG